jgi:serine/threonine protein kinase
MPPSGLSGVGTESDPPSDPAPTDPTLTVIREDFDAAGPLSSTAPKARPAPVRTTLHPGVLLDGRYQLQRHISDRGPLQLWLGEDQVLARPVAIRLMIDTGLPTSLEAIHQLLDAARRSGQLIHNAAASTYDATTTSADGLPLAYVVSEWVTGISLLDLLREAPLHPDRAAAVQLSVARVVAAAHAVGVTHGDLHPGDVIITSHGLVKVLDLEMRSSGGGASSAGERSVAERQARDVTGLGALLYASLTGRWPLGPGRGLPTAEIDGTGACRNPRQLRAGVPRELDALAMAALGGRGGLGPLSRQPTAAEMVDALLVIGAEMPTGSHPVLDDDPAADTPGARIARAAQAERLARTNAARQRTLRRRVLPLVLLVVLALLAWVIGVAVDRLPSHSGGGSAVGSDSAAAASKPVALASVTDFDPSPGDGAENPTEVGAAHDGNPNTAWSTEQYFGSQWGGIKSGVGLKVDLGKPIAVSRVRLLFKESGVSIELRYADADSASLDAYTVAVSSPSSPKADQTLIPHTGAHEYWLIWLTALPRVPPAPGSTNATYEGALAEMQFFG